MTVLLTANAFHPTIKYLLGNSAVGKSTCHISVTTRAPSLEPTDDAEYGGVGAQSQHFLLRDGLEAQGPGSRQHTAGEGANCLQNISSDLHISTVA